MAKGVQRDADRGAAKALLRDLGLRARGSSPGGAQRVEPNAFEAGARKKRYPAAAAPTLQRASSTRRERDQGVTGPPRRAIGKSVSQPSVEVTEPG